MYRYNNNHKALSMNDLTEMPNAVNVMSATFGKKHNLYLQSKQGVIGRVRNLLQRATIDLGGDECYPLFLLDPNNQKLLLEQLNKSKLLNCTEGTRVWSADGTSIREDIEETLKYIKDPANLKMQVMIKKIQLQEELDPIRTHFLDPASELNKKIDKMQKTINAAKQQILDIKSKGLAVDVSVLNGTIATIEAKQYNKLVEDNALICNRIDGCIKAVDDELLRMASIKGITDARRNSSYNEILNGGGIHITGVGLIRAQDQLLSPAKAGMMNIIASMPANIDVDINKLDVLLTALKAATAAAGAAPKPAPAGATPTPAAGAAPKPAPAGATPTPAAGAVPKPAPAGATPTPAAGAMPKPAPAGATPTPAAGAAPKPAPAGATPTPASGAVPKPAPAGATPTPAAGAAPKPAPAGATPTPAAGAVPKPAPAARPLTDDERKAAFADYWRSNRFQFSNWRPGAPVPEGWNPTDDVADGIRRGTWKPRP